MLRTSDKRLFVGRKVQDVFPHYRPSVLTTEGENLATSIGTVVTPGGVANTKTAWVQLVAATPHAADGFFLTIKNTDTAIADYLADIGVGGAGSEVVILENVLYTVGGGDSGGGLAFIPIPIAAGTRIAVRAQATDTAAVGLMFIVSLVAGSYIAPLRLSRATTYGAVAAGSGGTTLDPGGTIHTKGAWAQISASLTNSFKCCLVCISQRNNAANTAQNMLLDIGLGAAASEVVVAGDLYTHVQATEDIVPKWMWLPIAASAGQRLAARVQSSSNAADDRLIDVVVIGFD